MDPNGLFREESFTDQKIGIIRKMIPVKADGSDDADRPVTFFGSTQVMTQMGAIPLNFPLDGETIGAAANDFAGAPLLPPHVCRAGRPPPKKTNATRSRHVCATLAGLQAAAHTHVLQHAV